LGLAEKTVKNHVTGLLAKMGFRRRTQAAAWVAAHRQGTGWNAG
jgi:DNA-binding NarL/FixJ family response regulator